MNENKRTITYLIVAAAALLIAWEPWSRRAESSPEQEAEKDLFPDFTDPLSATSMRIVKYDEDTGAFHPFQVSQVNNLWSIPSHQNYPADARDHLAEAATSIIDLKILGVASTKPGEHEMFGVLDPDGKDVTAGASGVGTRVTMKGKDDNVLADLIIGKDVKDRPELRYVRKPARDQVYTVAVKTDKLSTRFSDWIEKDLLKLNAFDVREVQLNDYSIVPVRGGLAQLRRSELGLDYDDSKAAWKLATMVEYEDGKPKTGELKEDEELNSEKLNALKTALDDLQIVDVERKPKGLKGLQFVEDVAKDQQSVQSLMERGFFPVPDREGNLQVYSKEGEVVCGMKDGVEYILRFGDIAGGESGKPDSEKKEDGKDKSSKDKDAGSKVNRFLFVMAQFNPDLIPKPNLEPLPGEEKKYDKSEAKADDKPAGKDKSAGKVDAAKKDADAKTASEKGTDEKTPDQLAAEEDAAERKKAEDEKRTQIEKENKRKQDEYEEKLKKGQEHVKELNARFADWYYIISDDVYHKIHLNRSDVVKAKEKKTAEGDTPADLKELQRKGLNK